MEYFIGAVIILIIIVIISQKNKESEKENQYQQEIDRQVHESYDEKTITTEVDNETMTDSGDKIEADIEEHNTSDTLEKSSEKYLSPNPSNEPTTEQIDITFDYIEDAASEKGFYLFVDIETTGLPKDRYAKPEDVSNWPYIVQIAWLVFNESRQLIEKQNFIIKQIKKIPQRSIDIHGITDEIAEQEGVEPLYVYEKLEQSIKKSEVIVAHNINFEIPIIQSDFIRNGFKKPFQRKKKICTMKSSVDYCAIPKTYREGYKYPTLMELFKECFYPYATSIESPDIHDANMDVRITAKCFFKLLDENVIIIRSTPKTKQKKIDEKIYFVEKISLSENELTDEEINELFSPADDFAKEATDLIKTEPELAIQNVINAINLFPYVIPKYFYKLAYYLQKVGFYEQTFEVLYMVINDLEKEDYRMYNMDLSLTYEKFCTYKYSEKRFDEYLFYYFKWLHNRTVAFACQGRIDEMNEILKSKDKLGHLAPTKMNSALKKLKIENSRELINQKISEYFNSISNSLIKLSKIAEHTDKNFEFESDFSFSESPNKDLSTNNEFIEIYFSLINDYENDYFKKNINTIINN